MAIGTFASRATGFLRTIIIGAAIGTTVGDAYNAANTLPNSIYDLLMGGVLGAVIVPLLVSAARSDRDGGEAYAERLFTLVVLGLGAATAVAFLFAPAIIHLYIGNHTGVRSHLATTFARFFLPQIFFYGVGAVLGAVLNVRGRFSPPMWAPVVNNVVVIVTGILFIAVTRAAQVDHGVLTRAQQLLLAGGTTLGIVAQTVALLPALRACRFRLRLRFDLRGVGLSRAVRLAAWVFVYVLVNQIAFLIITRLAYASGYLGTYTIYTYAFTLVLLPYAVVAVSVITALLPHMSRSAQDGRLGDVGTDLANGLKVVAVVLVPSAFAGIALGPLIGVVLFAHRTLSLATGGLVGATLAGFSVSLLPFAAFQLQLRAFYALQDTRTPALANIVLSLINVAADGVFFLLMPPRERAVGLALGYSVSYLIGYWWFGVLLRRRLGRPPRAHVARTVVRLSVAGALAATVAYISAHTMTAVVGNGVVGSALGLMLAAVLGTTSYVWMVLRMRVPEVRQLATLATGPLGAIRRPPPPRPRRPQ
jgi:putative peptidoglycan lipid II flippase